MGSWHGPAYFGTRVECPQCKRNFVKQEYKSKSYTDMSCKYECCWCGCKWTAPRLVQDNCLTSVRKEEELTLEVF